MVPQPGALPHDLLVKIADAIRSIQYGSVQITIHDSRVVQIEKAEKIRVPEAHLISGGALEDAGCTDRTTGGSRTGDGH